MFDFNLCFRVFDYARYKNYIRSEEENIVLIVNAYLSNSMFMKNGMFFKEFKQK